MTEEVNSLAQIPKLVLLCACEQILGPHPIHEDTEEVATAKAALLELTDQILRDKGTTEAAS